MISVSLALIHTPAYTARACASRGVSVYYPAITGTHCVYSRRDGQAELMVGWFTRPYTVTHPRSNRARRTVISLIETRDQHITAEPSRQLSRFNSSFNVEMKA